MKPYFLAFKSLTITWFMFFTFICIISSSIIVNILAKKFKEDKNIIEDIFIITLILGFVGARLSYALVNFDLYKDNIFSILKISHYNLSLIGGIVFGLITLRILSYKYEISFYRLLRIFVISFYFSIGVMAWLNKFDILFLSFYYIKSTNIEILFLILLSVLGIILEMILPKKTNNKYMSIIILFGVIAIYYIM